MLTSTQLLGQLRYRAGQSFQSPSIKGYSLNSNMRTLAADFVSKPDRCPAHTLGRRFRSENKYTTCVGQSQPWHRRSLGPLPPSAFVRSQRCNCTAEAPPDLNIQSWGWLQTIPLP